MKLLEGKSAIITGGTRGIGRGIVLEFAKAGAKVAFTYRSSEQAAKELEDEVKALGAEVISFQADAGNPEDCQTVVDGTIEAFGSLDVVVNNAGITKDNLLMRMSEDQFDDVIKTNLYSVFYMTKASIRQMLRQRSGSFINISSIVGVTGNAGQANYAASKAGMIAFTKSTAKELSSRNIRANVVAPGFIATEMTDKIPDEELKKWLQNVPLNRPGSPEDIANSCIFLASDMAAYITGQVLHVDGGMYM